jgi:hypothetical protein
MKRAILVWWLFLVLGCAPAGQTAATGQETLAQVYSWAQRICGIIGAASPLVPRPATAPPPSSGGSGL